MNSEPSLNPEQAPHPQAWPYAPPASGPSAPLALNPWGTPPPGAPPPAPPYAAKPPVDGFAITSVVFGVVGGVLLSLAFGIASLRRISRGKRRGRPLAITGLALSLVWVIVIVAVLAYHQGRQPDRNTVGAVTHEGQIAPADLRIGDCLTVPEILSGTYLSVTVIPCAQPHNGQVFDILQAQGVAYPGDAAVQQGALADCKAAMPAFLGTSQTPLHIVAYFPPEKSWQMGRRDEHCLLVDRANNITGDIRSDK